ncbi:hypothetical protein BY996DRAFT_6419333 [Phakopsora pachyrhizi]|nr:hypothetical protein BY996DRAFT_6419333 [Phakopsora pachyrhizi]
MVKGVNNQVDRRSIDPSSILNALLTIHSTAPNLISTPSILQQSVTTNTADTAQTTQPRANNSTNNSSNNTLNNSIKNVGYNRRASVAIVLQLVLDWVTRGRPEILYIRRVNRNNHRSATDHLAFPGGRMQPDDGEDGLFCAMRETWEEVGIDLSVESDFIKIGRLDDREITTSLGKRLLMVLSPYVFLYVGGHPRSRSSRVLSIDDDLNQSDGLGGGNGGGGGAGEIYWTPIDFLIRVKSNDQQWGEVTIDLSSRLVPPRLSILGNPSTFHPSIRFFLKLLIGSMRFKSILVPLSCDSDLATTDNYSGSHQQPPFLQLWGLTLGMTLQVLICISFLSAETSLEDSDREDFELKRERKFLSLRSSIKKSSTSSLLRAASFEGLNELPRTISIQLPSIASIFPKFTHPDINALIYILGRRYRRSISNSNQYNQNRSKWLSIIMNEFYRSVRKSLILAILIRFSFGMVGVSLLVRRLIRYGRQLKKRN